LGFFLHASLVVNAHNSHCLGYSDLTDWSREAERLDKKERKYASQPIEQKESYRWIKTAQQSAQRLVQAGKLTIVQDREGDITESFVQRGNYELLIRLRSNRLTQEGKLYEYLSAQAIEGTFGLTIKGDLRKKRSSRTAQIAVRYKQVHLTPVALKGQTISVFAVEAREMSPPVGESPVLWRLITTHPIHSFQQACQVIHWYALRWNIEQVFRLTKQKGFNVEESDLERGSALIILTLLACQAAVQIMLLHLASKETQPQPLHHTFSAQQMACMKVLCAKYEGNTHRQKNSYTPDSLQWCYWVLARLGGWKPQEKQAGVIALLRGWTRFQQFFEGWALAIENVS